jgi:hypothetical protein
MCLSPYELFNQLVHFYEIQHAVEDDLDVIIVNATIICNHSKMADVQTSEVDAKLALVKEVP